MTAPDLKTVAPSVRDYTLRAKIGEGATGEVWLAADLTEVLRAVKVIKSSGDGKNSAILEKELNGVRQLQSLGATHPNICLIHHIGTTDEKSIYYVMELADNTSPDPNEYVADTLLHRIQQKTITHQQALDYTIQLARALDHLHRNKLIHRDIKPANIVFVKGVPKIADIGLLREWTDNVSTIAGTPAYMPPEFIVDGSGDVYALGKVLYEMVTG